MADVDVYIMRFNPEVQQRLIKIRRTALDVFGSIDEKIHHGLPAFSAKGRVIMFYAAYKAHISICVGYDWIDFLRHQYPEFHYTQATIQFLHKDPFPDDIVRVICELVKQGLGGRTKHNAETS